MLHNKMKSVFASCVFYYFYIFNVRNVVVLGKIEYITYPTVHVRATPYSPKVVAKTCLLKTDQGPCRGNIPMYYYDPKMKNCTQFRWGGCQGNGNRFDTRRECLDFCLSKPNPGRSRPNWCSLSFDFGFCFGAIERWYYDHMWKVCKKTIYSGCGGNQNNFYSMEQCESVCRFGLGAITKTTKSQEGMKKVLIINPWDTTIRRGRDQSTAPATITSGANVTTKAG